MGLARRHHLGDDIDTHRHQIANGMGIVGTHVMPLLGTIIQVTAGFEEELRDLNILRKTVCRYIPGIGQFRNPAIEALNKRPHETLFQRGAALWRQQRQCRNDVQADFRIVFRPLV